MLKNDEIYTDLVNRSLEALEGGVQGSPLLSCMCTISLGPRPSIIFGFVRAWYAKIRHVASFWTSVGVSMETPPFTMTSFQSVYGQVAAWCEYTRVVRLTAE